MFSSCWTSRPASWTSVMIRPGADQLGVREDVAVQERTGLGEPVVVPGDAVVEQPALRAQPVADEAEVRRVLLDPDVLGEPDRGDRVEAGLLDVPVVHEPHLGEVVEALLLDPPLRPGRLLAGQRHAEGVHAVLARGVPDHAAPAAAEVEQPLARLEVELAGDQVVLRVLRLLEGGRLGREQRAGVGHRRAQHVLVEARWTRRSGGGSRRRRDPASAGPPRACGAAGTATPAAAARPA